MKQFFSQYDGDNMYIVDRLLRAAVVSAAFSQHQMFSLFPQHYKFIIFENPKHFFFHFKRPVGEETGMAQVL